MWNDKIYKNKFLLDWCFCRKRWLLWKISYFTIVWHFTFNSFSVRHSPFIAQFYIHLKVLSKTWNFHLPVGEKRVVILLLGGGSIVFSITNSFFFNRMFSTLNVRFTFEGPTNITVHFLMHLYLFLTKDFHHCLWNFLLFQRMWIWAYISRKIWLWFMSNERITDLIWHWNSVLLT